MNFLREVFIRWSDDGKGTYLKESEGEQKGKDIPGVLSLRIKKVFLLSRVIDSSRQ